MHNSQQVYHDTGKKAGLCIIGSIVFTPGGEVWSNKSTRGKSIVPGDYVETELSIL